MRGLKRRRAWVTSAMENGNTFYGIFAGSNSGPLPPNCRDTEDDPFLMDRDCGGRRGLKRRRAWVTSAMENENTFYDIFAGSNLAPPPELLRERRSISLDSIANYLGERAGGEGAEAAAAGHFPRSVSVQIRTRDGITHRQNPKTTAHARDLRMRRQKRNRCSGTSCVVDACAASSFAVNIPSSRSSLTLHVLKNVWWWR